MSISVYYDFLVETRVCVNCNIIISYAFLVLTTNKKENNVFRNFSFQISCHILTVTETMIIVLTAPSRAITLHQKKYFNLFHYIIRASNYKDRN